MNIFASNIGYQALQRENLNRHKILDRKIEENVFCSILGVVECNNKHQVNRFLKYVHSNGCTDLKKENTIEKRDDTMIGRFQHISCVSPSLPLKASFHFR